MPKYYIKTYGCQMNVADSEKLAHVLESFGYQSISISEGENQKSEYQKADIILVNTCCVREHAENRAFGFIASLKNLKKKNRNLVIGVCGCIPKEDHIDLKSKFPFVDLIFGPNEPEKLAEYLHLSLVIGHLSLSKQQSANAGFVSIMHGCDNFCSYCIVPYVRGREYSRPMEEVLGEIRLLIESGVQRITLLGQNVNSYKYGLANLLRSIKAVIPLPLGEGGSPERQRVRVQFLTSHPRDMSDEIIETVQELPYVAKEFHLPVQSGNDEVLARMNRGYTAEYYRNLIGKIRSLIPDTRITTDVIVGFPGETEEQFEDTLNLIKEIKFNAVNMAAYSIRAQTAAAKMEGNLPEEIKQNRLQRLIALVRSIVSQARR